MMGKLIVVVVLLVAGVLAYENGRKIDESHVRAHYQAQLEALRAFDEEAVCAAAADDFSLKVVERGEGPVGSATLDGAEACELNRQTLKLMQMMSGQTGGMVTIDVNYNIKSIEIAPGGRSATVESTSTAKVGDMLLSRSRNREELSRSFWRIRSHGGEVQVWSYGR